MKSKKYEFFHGSPIKNLEVLKIMEKDNGHYNDLGYGVYVAHKDWAEGYKTDDGSLYKVIVRLHKELKEDDKTLNNDFMENLSHYLLTTSQMLDEELCYFITDYLGDIISVETKKSDLTLLELENTLSAIYNDCHNDKDFFNILYRYDNEIDKEFVKLGYTHTFSNLKGFEEWCLLPGCIMSVTEEKE